MGKQIKVFDDNVSKLYQGTLNNVVVKEEQLIELSRDKEDFSGDLSRWTLVDGGQWLIEYSKLKGIGEGQSNGFTFDHELDYTKRLTIKVYIQDDMPHTGVNLSGAYCRRYSGGQYQGAGIMSPVLPWDSNWRFEYYPHLKTFDWYVGDTLVLSGLSLDENNKSMILYIDEAATIQYFDDLEIIYWEAKGSIELVELNNQFINSTSFEECSGEHIGNIADPNSVVTDIGGGWTIATHYNTATIRVESNGGYHGNKRVSFIHDGSSGWKGARASTSSITEGKWYRVSVRAIANKKSDLQFSWGYAFYSGTDHIHFLWDIQPIANPGKWCQGIAIFQASQTYASGSMYLYGLTDGENGLVLDYDAIMWEEFDEDPTGLPFGFTIDQGYPFEGGERIANAIDISTTEITQKVLNLSDLTTPAGTSLEQYSSIDNGLTWQRVNSNQKLSKQIGLKCDGVDDYVLTPSTSKELHFYDGVPETVEMKVKPKNKYNNYFLFQHYGWSRRIKWSGNSFSFIFSDINIPYTYTTDPIYPPNQIYDVAYSVDENLLLTLYVNQAAVGNIQLNLPLRDAADYWLFGSAWAGSSQYFFEGTIYEVRMWRICRTGAEMQTDSNKHLAGNEPGLVGYWTFNEGEGTIIKDRVFRGNTLKLDAAIAGKAEWELTPISGDMTGKNLLLKQKLYTDNPTLTPQLKESLTLVHPANAILVSDEFKNKCKDFANIFDHHVTIYNETLGIDITNNTDISSFSLDVTEKGLTGLVNANSLSFRVNLNIDESISAIVKEGDIIKVKETFNNETISTFYGFVNETPVNYKSLEHLYTVNIFDNLRKGMKGKFAENEVKIGWYLCNNFEPEKSLAHYLAGLIGFDTDSVIFEDITDGTGTHISVHYTHLEKGNKYITELVTLVKSVQGKLYVNQEDQLILTSPFNEEDFHDISYTFDEEIQTEVKISTIKAQHDSVEVTYDSFNIAERQVCWMLYDKQSYDKANDNANMLIKSDTESAWIKIELVTPICINLDSTPEIIVEDSMGNDMSTFFQYDIELDMTGGKLKLYNIHPSDDLYIQRFKIYGEPLEKLSGHEYFYNEVENPDNPISVSNKYIQNEVMAEMNAKYTFHTECKDRRQYTIKCNYTPFVALSNLVSLKKRDIDVQCTVSEINHKPEDNYLITNVELIEFLPFEGFSGISIAIQASPNVREDLHEFEVDKIKNDGIFSEGLPVPVPQNVKCIGLFKHIWIEWDKVNRSDLLGYNVHVNDGSETTRQYFEDSNKCVISSSENDKSFTVQVSTVTIAGESSLSSSDSASTVSVKSGDIPVDQLLAVLAIIEEAYIDDAMIVNLEADKITTTRAKINGAQIGEAEIANAHISNLHGSKIDANSITTDKLQVGKYLPLSKPVGSTLWHFDKSVISTNGTQPTGTPLYTLRPKQGKFNGAVAVEEGTENFLNTVGGAADQDWSKWSHFNLTYWGAVEQYDDPIWGKVFKGTKDGAISTATYLYDYYPYTYAIGDVYSFSCWMKVNKDVTKSMGFYLNSSAGGQHDVASVHNKAVTFKAGEWQYITWTSGSVLETVTATGGFGIRMGTGWEGYIVEVAYPQFEKKSFATSFVSGFRGSGSLKYDPGEVGLNFNEGTFACWFKPSAGFFIPSWTRIIGHSTATNYNEIQLMKNNNTNRLAFAISNLSGAPQTYWDNVTSSSELIADNWYHLTGVWSESQGYYAIYINGVEENRKTLTSEYLPSVLGDLAIGYHPTYAVRVSNSLFDEVIVSPLAHTPEEIKAWYELKSPFYDQASVVTGGGTIIDANGLRAYDKDGNQTVNISSAEGNAQFRGTIHAETALILPVRSTTI